jgi:hypothetical protein
VYGEKCRPMLWPAPLPVPQLNPAQPRSRVSACMPYLGIAVLRIGVLRRLGARQAMRLHDGAHGCGHLQALHAFQSLVWAYSQCSVVTMDQYVVSKSL